MDFLVFVAFFGALLFASSIPDSQCKQVDVVKIRDTEMFRVCRDHKKGD